MKEAVFSGTYWAERNEIGNITIKKRSQPMHSVNTVNPVVTYLFVSNKELIFLLTQKIPLDQGETTRWMGETTTL